MKKKKVLVDKVCEKCGSSFIATSERRFCSRRCSNACKPPQKLTGVHLNCKHCGAEFYVQRRVFDRGTSAYCSKKCKGLATRGENSPGWKPDKKKVVKKRNHHGEKCINCNGDLAEGKKFCSRKCRGAWDKKNHKSSLVERTCVVCQKKFYVAPAVVGYGQGRMCSRLCFKTYASETWVGENNPKWRGGCKRYYGPDWVKQRRLARKRDGYKCRRCGITQEQLGKSLDVHHIVRFNDFDSHVDANKLSNLVSLCPSCHTYTEHNGVDF